MVSFLPIGHLSMYEDIFGDNDYVEVLLVYSGRDTVKHLMMQGIVRHNKEIM